jgi:hypothetical protein
MSLTRNTGRFGKYGILPTGDIVTIADIPLSKTRWVIGRKAKVVLAVDYGLLSLEEACRRYSLTIDEFLSWRHAIESHGLVGLRTTRQPRHRRNEKSTKRAPTFNGQHQRSLPSSR